MKFINGHQPVVKRLGPKNVIGTAEGGMGADKGSIGAVEKGFECFGLAVQDSICIQLVGAEVPFWVNRPVGKETARGQIC